MNLKYPIGTFSKPGSLTVEQVLHWGKELAKFPEKVRTSVSGFKPDQFLTKTLPGNWTVAQVIHHLADSHMNALIRMKLTLTEESPTIKPYDESSWINLADSKISNVSDSLAILDGVHSKMQILSSQLKPEDLTREYYHPENRRKGKLGELFALYLWHGNHHLAHIQLLKEEKGW